MKAPVSLDRAKTIIQGWYNEYCKDHGKSTAALTTPSIKLFTWNVKYTRVMGLF